MFTKQNNAVGSFFNQFLIVALTLFAGPLAFAVAPAFEAYSKFFIGGVHAGYAIHRFELDDKKNQMTSTYYTFVKTPTNTTTESLVAKAKMNFEPISFKYTALVDGEAKMGDGTFKNKQITGSLQSGSKKATFRLNVPTNGFLSTFLNYVVLKNGLTVGKSYTFSALAEEAPACLPGDANCKPSESGFVDGTVLVKSEETFKGQKAYRLNIDYKGISFHGFVNSKGETLSTVSPLQNASTEMVATKAEAVGNFPFNAKHIKAVFGNEPAGNKNSLHAASQKEPAAD